MLSAKNEEIPEIDDGMLWITLCLHQNAMNREGPRGRASSGYHNGGWRRRFSRVLSRWPWSLACHHFLHGRAWHPPAITCHGTSTGRGGLLCCAAQSLLSHRTLAVAERCEGVRRRCRN